MLRSLSCETGCVALAISPARPDVLLSANSVGSNDSVSLASMGSDSLSKNLSLSGVFSRVHSLQWGGSDGFIVGDTSGIRSCRTDGSEVASKNVPNCSAACLMDIEPQSSTIIASAGNSIELWDTRSQNSTLSPLQDSCKITCLDVNRNRPHMIAIGCEDGRISFLDIRKLTGKNVPIQIFDAHNHHVTKVRFNPLRDELVLSSGTDCGLNVWCCESSSSRVIDRIPALTETHRAPLSPLTNSTVPYKGFSYINKYVQVLTSKNDRLVSKIDRHTDTVRSVCWSHASPWVFASVSEDGLVMVNSVPKSLTS
jgi:WD40 repeat protein